MGLSQAQIDALKAERAQLFAQEAQDPATVQNDFPAGGDPGLVAQFNFPRTAQAATAPDSAALPQIQVGENVSRQLGQPDPGVAAQTPAALTPEQINALKAERAQLADEEAKAAPQEEGKLAKLWEKIHPTKTEAEGGVINPDLEKLPDWTMMAEPAAHPINTARAALGTLISNIDETKDVIKEQFPQAKVEKKGAYLLITQPDGSQYSWKPGMRASDFARAAATIPVAAPVAGAAAAGAALLGAPAAAAGLVGTLGSAAYLESLKSSTGGGFSAGNVVGAGLLHGVLHAPGAALRALGVLAPEASGALAGAEGAAIQPGTPPAPEVPAAPVMSEAELSSNLASAGRGSSSAARAVAGQVRPDPELLTAAQGLVGADGQPLVESLTPAHLSGNRIYQRLANAAAGAGETHAEAARGLGGALKQAWELAGAPSNQGALENQVKNAITRRLDAAARLVDETYAAIDGADAVAASEGSPGRPAVQGIVARSAPAPVPEFNSVIETARKDLGNTLPKAVEKLRAELFSGAGADGVPTRAMVNRIRMMVGRDIGAGGKKYGIGLAHDMYNALDAAYLSSAEKFRPEAGQLLADGKRASIFLREARDLTNSVLGERAQNSLTDKITQEVGSLAHGTSDEFSRVMSVAPDAMKPGLARFALRQFVDRAGSLDVRALNDWFKAMKGNPSSWNALKMYIGEDLANNLESTAKISSNVEAAMNAVRPRQPFPEPWNLPGIAKKMLKMAVLAKFTGPLGAGAYALGDRILAPPSALNTAVGEYLASPAARAFMAAEMKGAVTPGMIRSVMENGLFRKAAHLANLPVHARQAFLAASTDQQQEAKQ